MFYFVETHYLDSPCITYNTNRITSLKLKMGKCMRRKIDVSVEDEDGWTRL
jgi:hypothetical protein